MKSQQDILKLSDFEFYKAKDKGIEQGAVYKLNGKMFMVKSMDSMSIRNEFIGAVIARSIVDGSAPNVYLVRDDNGNILSASEYIENFQTGDVHIIQTFKNSYLNYELGYGDNKKVYRERLGSNVYEYTELWDCFPNGCIIKSDGSIEHIIPFLIKIENENQPNRVHNTELVDFATTFVGYYDTLQNLGNRGIINSSDKIEVAIIDFSRSLEGLSKPLIYLSDNYNQHALIKALDKICSLDLNNLLEESFETLKRCYPQDIERLDKEKEDFKDKFAKRIEIFRHEKTAYEYLLAKQNHDEKTCNHLIPLIKQNQQYISDEVKFMLILSGQEFDVESLHIATEEHVSSALSNYYFTKGQIILKDVIKNNIEIYQHSSDQTILRDCLKYAIYYKNEDQISKILPKITDPLKLLDIDLHNFFYPREEVVGERFIPNISKFYLYIDKISELMTSSSLDKTKIKDSLNSFLIGVARNDQICVGFMRSKEESKQLFRKIFNLTDDIDQLKKFQASSSTVREVLDEKIGELTLRQVDKQNDSFSYLRPLKSIPNYNDGLMLSGTNNHNQSINVVNNITNAVTNAALVITGIQAIKNIFSSRRNTLDDDHRNFNKKIIELKEKFQKLGIDQEVENAKRLFESLNKFNQTTLPKKDTSKRRELETEADRLVLNYNELVENYNVKIKQMNMSHAPIKKIKPKKRKIILLYCFGLLKKRVTFNGGMAMV